MFAALLDNLQTQLKVKQFPHKWRVVAFVDKRQNPNQDAKDNVFVYAPPMDCRSIPNDAVPEWHMNASRTCLLPNLKYKSGAKKGMTKKLQSGGDTKEKLQRSNITTAFHCKGSLMTLSVIAQEVDVVQCYLYWNGQMTRFMPQDVKVLFPKLFNMKWNVRKPLGNNAKSANESFVESKELDAL